MAFIFGVATQEADLYKIFRDYISGCGRPGKVVSSGAGNGALNNLIYPQGSAALYETITLTCVSVATRGGTFSVVGSASGVLPDAVVGTVYKHALVEFYIDFGSTDFALGDSFTLTAAVKPSSLPGFSKIKGKPGTKTETITLTCVTAGQRQIPGTQPFLPAVFDVVGSVSGTLPQLTQGVDYNPSLINLLLGTDPLSLNQYTVGQTITLETTINPLRAVNQQWAVLRRTPDGASSQFGNAVDDTDSELVIVGPGLAGTDTIYYGMVRAWSDSEARAHWTHYGITGYIPNVSMVEQPTLQGGQTGVKPIHTFWSLNIPYVIIASGRCFKVLTRSNIYYSQSYAGFALPNSLPKYWGYPYVIGGCGDSRDNMWSSLPIGRASFWNYKGHTTGGSGYLLDEGRTWQNLLGDNSEISNNSTYDTSTYMRWGKHCSVYPSGSRYMYDLRANLDGSVPVFRQALTPNYGFLDGVYAVPGRDGRQPEEIMVMRDGRRMYITQNHHRSGFNDFCAFELG